MDFNGKTGLVIITGASRGIGKELALQLSKLFLAYESTFVLMARNEAALAELKEILLKSCPGLQVEYFAIDFSQSCNDVITKKIRQLEKDHDYNIRLIIHNAGSLGDMTKKSSELNDESQWHAYLQTNLVSTVLLNNQLFNVMKKEASTIIINITSLLSIKAFPSFTQYSVGKAAREAYFRAFAVEHPKCRVLSYSPGPVDTEMHTQVCETTYDANVKELFSKRHETSLKMHRKLLSTTETVERFIQILEKNKFENGSRIDYFDE